MCVNSLIKKHIDFFFFLPVSDKTNDKILVFINISIVTKIIVKFKTNFDEDSSLRTTNEGCVRTLVYTNLEELDYIRKLTSGESNIFLEAQLFFPIKGTPDITTSKSFFFRSFVE